MQLTGDIDYFSKNPEFHMYLHPENPSYEMHIEGRDRMFRKHPDLVYVGAHLGSQEWSVDELANSLDTFPHMSVDLAERISYLQYQSVDDYSKVYNFIIKSPGQREGRMDESGLSENTIVVYTSDQGFYLDEHGWYDKRFMYKESHGTPLLMRYPGVINAGQKINDFVLNLDFAPTFLNYAGVNIPDEMQGEPIGKLFDDVAAGDWRKSVYYHYYEYPHVWHSVNRHYGIRRGELKLIYFYQKDQWEFFDLETDPDEVDNLINNPEYQDIISVLKKEFYELKQEYGDLSDQPDVNYLSSERSLNPIIMRMILYLKTCRSIYAPAILRRGRLALLFLPGTPSQPRIS